MTIAQTSKSINGKRQSDLHLLDELNEIRHLLGAGPGVTALEAVTFLVKDTSKEIAEERAAASVLRVERDAARRECQSLVEMVKLFVRERDEAIRERNEARAMLSIERDITRELRATLKIPIGVSLTRTVKRLAEERDEARRECNSDFVSRIASILGASRDETTLNAAARVVCERDAYLARVKDPESDVCKPAKERDEANMRHAHAKAERDGARRERDEAQAALAKANASLETERIAGRVANEFWQARIATLEAAIRNLAKVLP